MARGRGPTVTKELLHRSRDAALNAVQTFNNPLTTFKAETFIVLMSIAWTYLLHAYYRREHIEYRYFSRGPKGRKFARTASGSFEYWDLAACLRASSCPLDEPTKSNLRFLIGLRNEIVHHQSTGVDHQFAPRYLPAASTTSATSVTSSVSSTHFAMLRPSHFSFATSWQGLVLWRHRSDCPPM